MTKDEFLDLRNEGFTFKEIGEFFNLSERQVNYRTKSWGLDYSKKKSVDEYYFENSSLDNHYWAGFLAADGWIEPNRHRVGLALQSQDLLHLEKFKKAIKSSHDICPFMSGSAYRIRFNSQKMCEDLSCKFNITGSKTFTYRMPDFEDIELVLSFLRGYVEGDGHIEYTASGKAVLHICSANNQFLVEFRELVEIIIGKTIEQHIVHKVNKKGSVFSLRFKVEDSMIILPKLYNQSSPETRLDRKYKVIEKVFG